MLIKTIATGSTGNCYLVKGVTESILIEAGIPVKKIKEGLDYHISDIACCLLSHEHGDHAKAVNDIVRLGKKVYSSKGTFKALGVKNYFAKHVVDGETVETREFIIKPFETQHDCAEPLGFLIESKLEYKKILFATDTYFIKYTFNDIDCFMLEVNFIEKHLCNAVNSGNLPSSAAERLRRSHMSLERAVKFLTTMQTHHKLRSDYKIMPIHVSSRFGDVDEIKQCLTDNLTGSVHFEKELEV